MIKSRQLKISLAAVLLLFMSCAVINSYEKDKEKKSRAKDDLYKEVQLFADAVSLIRSDYVDEVDSKKLIYGALDGMLSSLDDYSSFLEPDEFNEIKVETKGEFGGIGIEISHRDGVLTVVTPIVGGPAEAAGVKPGDKIVKIDGVIMKNINMNEAVKKLRGKPGTNVTITVWREEGGGKILDIKITRAMIKIQSIRKSEFIEDKIGYIRLVEFQQHTSRDLENALKKLEAEGMDSLILDLRNNPGGLLDAAVDVAGKFLPKDKAIVSIKSRKPEENMEFKSSGIFTHPDYPLIVMVNHGSASGSEIVAGAVKDNGRGVILGEKTFGKASVQAVIPLGDGSALRLTTASYYTPSGKLIRDQGITPDVIVGIEKPRTSETPEKEDVYEKVEAKEKVESKETKSAQKLLEEDNQLAMAVDIMKALKVYKQADKK